MATIIAQQGGKVAVGRFYRVTMFTTALDNQTAMWGWHFRCATISTGTGVNLGEIAKAIQDACSGEMQGVFATASRMLGCKVADVSVGEKPLPGICTDTNSGSVGTGPQATQSSGIIRWVTATAGRKGRGRSYVPFPPTEFVDDATTLPNDDYMTAMNLLAQQIRDVMVAPIVGTGATCQLAQIIFHRGDTTFTDVTGFVLPRKWATQKRRGSYAKTNPNVIT